MARRLRDPEILKRFGARLRSLREQRGITQQTVSERMQVRASTISQFERGVLAPTLTTVAALAQVLRCSPGELVGDAPTAVVTDAPDVDLIEITVLFHRLAPPQREAVLGVARAMIPAEAVDVEDGTE